MNDQEPLDGGIIPRATHSTWNIAVPLDEGESLTDATIIWTAKHSVRDETVLIERSISNAGIEVVDAEPDEDGNAHAKLHLVPDDTDSMPLRNVVIVWDIKVELASGKLLRLQVSEGRYHGEATIVPNVG